MKIVEGAKKSRLDIIASMNEAADQLNEKGNYKEEIKVRKEIITKAEELVGQIRNAAGDE